MEPNDDIAKDLDGITEEDLALLREESDILDGGDHVVTAERLFKENLPQAVLNIVKLASHAQSDRVRLDASKYIVERNMGRLQDINTVNKDPLEEFAKRLFEEAEVE